MTTNFTQLDPGERPNSRWLSAVNWWVNVPSGSAPAERRAYNQMVVSLPFGLLFHIALIFLFLYWGVPQLAVANIFSVLIWTASTVALRNHRTILSVHLIYIEVIAHAALVIYFIGWGMGMQYFLIPLIAGGAMGSFPPWLRNFWAGLTTFSFILFYFFTQANTAAAVVDPAQLNIVNILVTASAFLIVYFMALYAVEESDRFEAQLAVEHEKSEDLLHNILPEAIAEQLKKSKGTIADQSDGASILFADVVNFTPMSAEMSATELVDLLNEVFSDFDELTEKHGLEKIKTIGDCYMVASGVPDPRADHAQAITQMALEMQEHVENHDYYGHKLAFRIGINSGPVVAGVIGRKKFIYDLWGDAVNTASRMESNGKGGCIQITEATYKLIKEDFLCDPQGTIHVKGKGEMPVWHVQKEKNSSQATI